MKFVQDGEISLRHYLLNKFLRPQYPLVLLMSPEEELPTSSKESSLESDKSEEDSEEQTKDNMEIDEEEEDTSAQPENKEGENDGKAASTMLSPKEEKKLEQQK